MTYYLYIYIYIYICMYVCMYIAEQLFANRGGKQEPLSDLSGKMLVSISIWSLCLLGRNLLS
jgi:hypothetical protein